MALNGERSRELGERLQELRGARPQRVIADRVKVTERTYGKWERGEGGIQWDNLETVADYFGVTTNFLLYGSNTPPQNVGSQLDRIEQKLDAILQALKPTTGQQADQLAQALRAAGQAVEQAPASQPSAKRAPGRRKQAAADDAG